jgi:Holliday junction resolvase
VSDRGKGRAFEHEIRHILKTHGFSLVRGAGSKGEFFGDKVDLIATKQTRQNEFTAYLTIIGVQCKVRRSVRPHLLHR